WLTIFHIFPFLSTNGGGLWVVSAARRSGRSLGVNSLTLKAKGWTAMKPRLPCVGRAFEVARVLSDGWGIGQQAMIQAENEPQIESQAAEPISWISLVARGDPPCRADVCAFPAVASERGGSAVRTRH